MHENAEKIRNEYKAHGLQNSEPRYVLALLLAYAQSDRDPFETADELLQHFGSYANILNADVEVLEHLPCLNKQAAFTLAALPTWTRAVALNTHPPREVLDTPMAAMRLAADLQIGAIHEVSYAVYMDDNYRHISTRLLSHGTQMEVLMPPRDIAHYGLIYKAKKTLLIHNHPGGRAAPSEADLKLTLQICDALQPLKISVVDHIIVANNACVSLYATNRKLLNRLVGYRKKR